jgi:hypothetical protein
MQSGDGRCNGFEAANPYAANAVGSEIQFLRRGVRKMFNNGGVTKQRDCSKWAVPFFFREAIGPSGNKKLSVSQVKDKYPKDMF